MKRFLILLALAALPMSAARADLIIDSFATPQRVEVATGSIGTAQGQVSGPGIIGGFRDMILTKFSGTPEASSEAFFDGTVGTLFFSAGVGNRAALEVQYDGGTDAANPITYISNGLTPFDITQGGANTGIRFQARSDAGDSDQIASKITFTLTANGADFSSTVTFIESNQFENYFIPFSSFAGLGNLATQVTALKFRIDATADASQDIAFRIINFANAVPAPSGLVLGGIAIAMGFGYTRRLRNKRMAI
jgi:hypothetical protein